MFTLPILEVLLSKGRSIFHLPSGVKEVKGLKFQWKTKKILELCWNFLKSDWLTSLGGFEWFLIFFDFV